MQGVQHIAQTERGSKPGDPFGDIIFNFLMSHIVRAINQGLASANIGFSFDVRSEFPGVSSGLTTTREVSYVDDLAPKVLPPSPSAVIPQLAVAAGIVVDGFGSHGIKVNLKPRKIEALVSFNGKGSRKASQSFARRAADSIPSVSRILGHLSLLIVDCYQHLGGKVHNINCMAPEVMYCAASSSSSSAELPIRKTILRNRSLPQSTRIILASSLSLSHLRFNSCTWSQLNAKATTTLGHRFISVYQGPTNLLNNEHKHASNIDVLVAANANSPNELLCIERLKYYWRAVHYSEPSLLALIAALDETPRSWTMLLRNGISVFASFVDPKDYFPRDNLLVTINAFILGIANSRRKSTINRIAKKMRLYRKIDASVRHFHDSFMAVALSAGLPVYVIQPPKVTEHQCDLCDFACFSLQGLNAHKKAIHGILHPANFYIGSTVCRACLNNFHTKNRALRHAKAAKRCLPTLSAWYAAIQPLPAVRKPRTGYNPAGHTPVVRSRGPLLPSPPLPQPRKATKARGESKAAKASAPPAASVPAPSPAPVRIPPPPPTFDSVAPLHH